MTEESLAARVARATAEHVDVIAYDPTWPEAFEREREHLIACLPPGIIVRVEHFGSTAVPGLRAKPIIDMLVEVTSLERVQREVVPILESQGYEYFWRPTFRDDGEPFYAWFIKRDPETCWTHAPHPHGRRFGEWFRRALGAPEVPRLPAASTRTPRRSTVCSSSGSPRSIPTTAWPTRRGSRPSSPK